VGSWLGLCHEVSILIIDLLACWRGVQPRSKVSMTIMRPPQHGHAGSLGSVSTASAGWLWGFGAASSSRASAMLSVPEVLASRP